MRAKEIGTVAIIPYGNAYKFENVWYLSCMSGTQWDKTSIFLSDKSNG